MKEEQNGTPKNKWSRLFRKKWFFPAVYLVVATLLLVGVVWYQNLDHQMPDMADDHDELTDTYTPNPFDEEAEPVVDQDEVVKMPVEDQEQTEIVTKFYDYNADEEDQKDALVFHNNRYHQSTGIDIAAEDGEPFDVTASLSGTVEEVKEDPLLGNVVTLSHGNDVLTYYASLDDIAVETGQEVEQGDTLGSAGKNLFGKDNGNHVHFEIRKEGKEYNPETFFNKPVSDIGAESDEEATEESDGGADDAQEEEMPENDRLEDEDTDTPDDVEDGETDED